MAHSHAEVPSLPCPQYGASFTAEIGLSGDEDKLREVPAAAVPPAVAKVLGTSVQEVNSEPTGRAGAELVTLEAAMAVAVGGAGKRGGKRRLAPAVMLGLLGASLLAACAPAVVEPQAGVVTIQAAQSTEVQGVVIVPTEEPTRQPEAVEVMATEVPTETPEPTAEPTATPEPEMGMQNEQGQWWDGAGWQSLPEGEGWQVSVGEDGRVTAVDGSGLEHTWENGGWVQERTLASGLEAFANSGVTGQLEMVYSVHPEIRINPEPAKNLYNYFIEVVTTSKGFAPYWQALGLWDHAGIMNYLEQNNYAIPTGVGGVYFPNVRITNGIVVTGQETDWVREEGNKLETIDLSKLGFMLIDDGVVSDSQTQIGELFGPNKIFYAGYGMSFSFRFFQFGDGSVPILIIKESMAESGTLSREDASLKGDPRANPEYTSQLVYQLGAVLRYMGTRYPNQAENNNCGRPGQTEVNQNGHCIPDNAEGIQDPDFLGVNQFTVNRLGFNGLFGLESE